MNRREQLLGLGDNAGSGLGEKVPSKKAEDSPTYWPAAAQTTKLPDQLGYLIKHPDGKLEVHSSMAWRLSNSKPELLWDDSFADNRFTIGVDLSAQGLETWCQLRAQNESMNRLAQEASGIIQGQLGKAIGGVNSPDLGLVQFQAQSRQVQRALGNSQHSQEALDEAEHDRRRMACFVKEYDECEAKKAAERDAAPAEIRAMITSHHSIKCLLPRKAFIPTGSPTLVTPWWLQTITLGMARSRSGKPSSGSLSPPPHLLPVFVSVV